MAIMEEINQPSAGEMQARVAERFILGKQEYEAGIYEKYSNNELLDEKALKIIIDEEDFFRRDIIRRGNEARAAYEMEPEPDFGNEQLHLISMGRIGVAATKLGFSAEERAQVRGWGAGRPYGARWADEMLITQVNWIDIVSEQESKEKPDKPYTFSEIEEDPSLAYTNKLREMHPKNVEAKRRGDVTVERFQAGIVQELAGRLQNNGLSDQEIRLQAMGEIGEKLEALQVGYEERNKIFERLAKHPETITKAAEAIKAVPENTKKLEKFRAIELVRHATGYVEEKAQAEEHKKTVDERLEKVRDLLCQEFGETHFKNGSKWIVASKEEIGKRLAAEKQAPITDAEWERIIIDDAEREMAGKGDREKNDIFYDLELADRKARYLKLDTMNPEEQEEQHQKNLEELKRMKYIQRLAGMTHEEWEAGFRQKKEQAGFTTEARERHNVWQDIININPLFTTPLEQELDAYNQWFSSLPPNVQLSIFKNAYEAMRPKEEEEDHPIKDFFLELGRMIRDALLGIINADIIEQKHLKEEEKKQK